MTEQPSQFPPPELTPRQREIIKELSGKIINNPDFISLETYNKIFDELGIKKGEAIIDIGAGYIPITKGATKYTDALNDRGVTLIPLDTNEMAIKSWLIHPQEKRYEEETMARPIVADAYRLPFAPNSITGALSINTINIIRKPEYIHLILQEVYRVLKPGGFTILSSFGYVKATKADGTVFYNNGFTDETIIPIGIIKQVSQEAGFSSITELPLRSEVIAHDTDKLTKEFSEQWGEHVHVEMVEPCGILLRK